MATDQDQTAGTPEPNDTDALEQPGTGGTSETDDRNAEPKGKILTEDQWNEVLQWKAGAEEAKRLKAERAQEGSAERPDTREPKPKPASRAAAEEWRQKGDGVAAYAIETTDELRQRLDQMELNNYLEAQLADVPPEDRPLVRKRYKENSHLYGDYAVTYRDIKAERDAKELERLRGEVATLKRGPDPEVMKAPPTGGREVPASQRKSKEYTYAQFDAMVEEARRSQGPLAAMNLQTQLNRGEIKLKD